MTTVDTTNSEKQSGGKGGTEKLNLSEWEPTSQHGEHTHF